MPLLTIEEITDFPLFALREQLRADLHREDQAQVQAETEWLARQEDEVFA